MFSQFQHGSLPDELNMEIMSYLAIGDLAAVSTVNARTNAVISEVILLKPISEIIEFLIFHPHIGLVFIDWLYQKNILPQIFLKKPSDDPWKIILSILLIENVQVLLAQNVRTELQKAYATTTISDEFKTALKISIDTMLNAMQQPFFFTGMPNTSQPNIFLNLKHAGFSFLGGNDFNFKYAELSESDFDFSIMKKADFRFATLTKAHFREGDVENCDFSYAMLKGTNFISPKITAVKFECAKMYAVKFSHGYVLGSNFSGCDLSHAKFKFSPLTSCDFSETDLTNALFAYCKIKDSDFSLAQLERTVFQSVQLCGVKFVEASLMDIDFSSCIQEGRFCGLNFYNAYLIRCNFSTQDLCDAIFIKARIVNPNFTDANLTGANFFEATLINPIFTNCKATGFHFLNGKFVIIDNDFYCLNKENQSDLNLGVILVLQYYLSRLIEAKRRDNKSVIAALKCLIKIIHGDLSAPLSHLIIDWQATVLAETNGATCEKAIAKRNVFYALSRNSFFEPITLKNEITEFIDQLLDISLAREMKYFNLR